MANTVQAGQLPLDNISPRTAPLQPPRSECTMTLWNVALGLVFESSDGFLGSSLMPPFYRP